MYTAATLGFTAAFMLAYQNSSGVACGSIFAAHQIQGILVFSSGSVLMLQLPITKHDDINAGRLMGFFPNDKEVEAGLSGRQSLASD